MSARLKVGDHVSWETSQGRTQGRIVKVLKKRTNVKGHTVAASADEPQYLVESDKTGAQAAHKADALRKG